VAASVIFSDFPELRGNARAARSAPIKNFVDLRLSATLWAAFGHFITMTRTPEDGPRGPEGDKGLVPPVEQPLSGKAAAKGRTNSGEKR
jgi:hypothetical protein